MPLTKAPTNFTSELFVFEDNQTTIESMSSARLSYGADKFDQRVSFAKQSNNYCMHEPDEVVSQCIHVEKQTSPQAACRGLRAAGAGRCPRGCGGTRRLAANSEPIRGIINRARFSKDLKRDAQGLRGLTRSVAESPDFPSHWPFLLFLTPAGHILIIHQIESMLLI